MTYKEAAQTALNVQDACNASGILMTLAGPVMAAIWEESRRLGEQGGTRFVNRSPIIAMFLYKVGELNGRDISSMNAGYEEAEAEVKAIIHREKLREVAVHMAGPFAPTADELTAQEDFAARADADPEWIVDAVYDLKGGVEVAK